MSTPLLKPSCLQTIFFQNSPLPCLLLCVQTGAIITANQAAVAFFNTTLKGGCFFNLVEATGNTVGLLKKLADGQPVTLRFKKGTETITAQVLGSRAAGDEPVLGVMVTPHVFAKANGENESLLAAMVNETSDVLTAADLDFKPITWSKAAEQLYGITAEQALGKSLRTYTDIQYNNSSTEDVRDQTRAKGLWRGEMFFVRPTDGKRLVLLITFKLIRDKDGTPLHYVISGADITEQKETETRLRETEKKLQQSEAFYRTLIADSVGGKLLTTPDGTINFASPAVQTLLGYRADELVGRNAFEFVHPDDHPVALTAFQNELVQAPKVKSIEVRVLKKDGTWLWCSVRGHNLLANPHIGSMVISLHDDTQRKQATDALKESEQRFRVLIKNLKLGVTLQDADGNLLMYNRATADLFGVDEAALEGSNLYEFLKKVVREDGMPFPPKDRPIRRTAQTKKPVENVVMGVYINDAAEPTWLLVNTNPVLDEAGNIRHIISSFTDVTGQKKLAQHLLEERLNQQRLLTQATIDGQERERKEIGKELHDNIGQQLATTKLYLDLAKAAGKTEMLDRAAKNIAGLINEVRAVSHSLVPPTLGDLGLVESVQELANTIGLVQHLKIEVQPAPFQERGLPENVKLMLYRIIQEALNNVTKHAQATTVQIQLQREGGTIALQIRDNGRGFEAGKIRKGLGLHNIRNRAEIFGGAVSIQSAPGAGCTVHVSIPDVFSISGR